jgi:hypothetical protein
MIDWKRRGLELARVVDRYRKERLITDRKLIWEIAEILLKLEKIEAKAQAKYFEWVRCEDRKSREKIFEEYLELIRKAGMNEETG